QELVSFLEYVGHPELPTSDEYAKLLTDRIADIKRNRTWEVKYMLLKEMLRDEREEGREEGAQFMILNLLQEHGEVPEDIRLRVMNEKDMSILKEMTRFAVRAKSFDDFRSQF
ncbi:MAG: hypothetical protein LUE86_09355, partial [Clostridiales bacterium]|nr:hypothetical protein [Clostridiales bacterium]